MRESLIAQERLLTHKGHIRRFVIEPAKLEGWVVREELDSAVLDRSRFGDWHRLERAVRTKISMLEREGWGLQPSR
mgnify:CR=1 FL=1